MALGRDEQAQSEFGTNRAEFELLHLPVFSFAVLQHKTTKYKRGDANASCAASLCKPAVIESGGTHSAVHTILRVVNLDA
jgi:hypothetical protein